MYACICDKHALAREAGGQEIRNTKVAVCCNVLHCAAVCCGVLWCAAVCCSVLQCIVAVQRSWQKNHMHTVQRVAVCCSVLQCVAVFYLV